METPPPDSGASGGPWTAPEPSGPREDPEVLEFLQSELLPTLRHRTSRAVRDAVRKALREQRLTALERLRGRHRHELLLALEDVVATERRPRPAVLVRLTTVVSATPAAPDLVGAAAVRPAR